MVDSIHESTPAEELKKKDGAAHKIRSSVKYLANKMSKDMAGSQDRDSMFLMEETMGIVVKKKTNNFTSLKITGKRGNFSGTNLVETASEDETILYSVKVGGGKGTSPMTAIFYNTSKFYPDHITVLDLASALIEQLTNPIRTKVQKVVSVVADIDYGSNKAVYEDQSRVSRSSEQKQKKTIEMSFAVEEEEPRVNYKMALKSSYECAFYETDKESWITGATSGCIMKMELEGRGAKLVTCKCPQTRGTSFAVLMSFDSDYNPLEGSVSNALLGGSLGCLLITFLAFLPAKELLRTRTVRLNLLLVTSLIFSIVTFYFMELVVTENIKKNNIPTETDPAPIPCLVIAFLMNYFWLCQMAWMVCEAVVMHRALVTSVMNSHIHRYLLKFNLACWGVPLLFPLVGIVWGHADWGHADPRTCFIRKKYGLITFYAPVALSILFNLAIFIRIAWSIFRRDDKKVGGTANKIEKRKKQLKFAVTVTTLLGLSWIFGFLLIIEGVNVIWLRWLFIVFNCSQGIFLFILYVVLNQNLREVWMKLLHISTKSNNRVTPATRPTKMTSSAATSHDNPMFTPASTSHDNPVFTSTL